MGRGQIVPVLMESVSFVLFLLSESFNVTWLCDDVINVECSSVPTIGVWPRYVRHIRPISHMFAFPYRCLSSRILGAFWYFFSVERETACWHLACENHIECDRSSFDCNHGSFRNHTFLNDYCPIQTPNTTVFDFGIFQGALQSGTVASMDFPRKILYCFWWGLRNLSSFGSNLQTSPHIWENCFAVLTSISGLLLFMYFLGRLQMYMQWETNKQLEKDRQWEAYKQLEVELVAALYRHQEVAQQKQQRREEAQRKQQSLEEAKQLEDFMQRWKFRMKARRNKIIEWIDRQPRLHRYEIKKKIICLVDGMFKEKEKQIMSEAGANLVAAESKISPSEYEDIDAENPLTHLPLFIRRDIRQHLCLPLLQKMVSEDTLKLISRGFLKEVYYNENSYIAREGEPLDALLFITQGIVWTYTSSPDNRQTGILKTDDFYGDELLEWMLQSPNRDFVPDPSNLPFSTRTLRCHTKVEAFALTAGNIQHLLDQHWKKFRKFRFDRLIRTFLGPNIQAAVPQTLDESDQKAKKAAS
ncbi:hypothetical protein F2P56_003816 [Juglans regia]|uniref:Cyclic nucleotide-binding domain-containing protein n=1 Tax=Juglans regia TaxID=51240 RepID=A0A834D0X7_JUGRE|nr:hypothetical protein F2P56_003816 [Juglans regia]